MYAKIEGAINPQNITKAFIRGLLKQVLKKIIHLLKYKKMILYTLENLSRLG